MADFLWGPLDPMPPDLGTWSEPVLDEARGQLRQERWLSPSAAHTPRYLCHQVRYCDRATGDIVQVVEARIKRQRRRRAN